MRAIMRRCIYYVYVGVVKELGRAGTGKCGEKGNSIAFRFQACLQPSLLFQQMRKQHVLYLSNIYLK